ncbi:alpha/beta hydrolase [Chryseobacterium gwangjuense]|uniref:hypothetical protein n=1 Tax=Chryseobacterium gwangjuense TaxID=1069980 RepID=UPI001E56C8D3|nr:hypothetical protein [Chryseobacterium gwangjuense]MCE3074160.1 hypothetical protein [Chryseobacterium gwangjuense]
MKVTKYIQLLLLIGILFQGFFSAQEKNIQAIKDEYAKKNSTVLLIAQSKDLKWCILKTKRGTEPSVELYSIDKNTKTPLPNAYSYHFTHDNTLVIALKEAILLKDFVKDIEHKVMGKFVVNVIDNNKVILSNHISKELMIYNSKGNKLFSIDKIGSYNISKDQKTIVMAKNGNLINLNTETLKKREIHTGKEYQTVGNTDEETWGLGTKDDFLFISRWLSGSNTITTKEITLPKHLKLYYLRLAETKLRQGRFFLIPVTPKTIENEKEIPEIYYSKLSYQYKDPIRQLAVYDLNNNTWKWLPKENDKYSTQQLVSDTDFISYDPITKNDDTLYNPKTRIQLICNFEDQGIKLHNPYTNPPNFYYAKNLKKLLFFENGTWKIENLKTGEVRELKVPVGTNFLSAQYSGLYDKSWEPPIPIKSDWVILTEEYDLFLLNLKNLELLRLTKGREHKQQYRIAKKNKVIVNTALDISYEIQDPFSEGLLVQMFDTRNFKSGLECITETGKVKWELKEDSYIRDVVRYKNRVLYTASFYNAPLAINIADNGKLTQTIATTQEKFDNFRYRLFKYKASDGNLLDAVLLYPKNYQKGKKYPMIVNVYENIAKQILNYQAPSFNDDFGFNYMHYVYQDYFVLLPQIDLKVGQMTNSIVSSIEWKKRSNRPVFFGVN